MYICLCKAVTDKDIHRAVGDGASSMRCLRQLNGVGSQCGRCVGHAKEVLGEALEERRSAQASSTQKEPVTVVTGAGSGVCYP
ncbi:MAG: bacterioferritin-associated ferredoxin [Idiomarina sp.]|nr:bacterioferritin-associated ferredoxin [Idiomarina sp.]